MRIAVIVLNFNDHGATIACVRSVLLDPSASSVIVVDNGSSPDDLRALRAGLAQSCHGVRLLASDVNGGFGTGMNLGIAAALTDESESILLLNNDTLVGQGAITALSNALSTTPNLGIAVPVVTTGDPREVWAAGGSVEPMTFSVRHLLAGSAPSTANVANDVSFAPGAALLVRAEVFGDVGGFVEGFFLYWEDVEFSMRVTGAGWRIGVVPGATVWHAVQGGRKQRTLHSLYYRTRNAIWLARTRYGLARSLLLIMLVILRGLKITLQRTGGHPAAACSGVGHVTRGVCAGLGRIPDLSPRRF